MTAIFKREFRSFFQSMIGYIFIAATLLLIGIYFYAYNIHGAYPYFSYTMSACVYVFLVTIPILTMKVLAEDRRNKTDQLILTAPVNVGSVVLGKFLAVASVFMIVIAITCLYPLIMALYGTVPMRETYGAIFGFFLYGLTGIAVGIFISSVTESQIIAAVLTFAALFVTYIMSGLCSMISSTGNLITEFLGLFDFYSRFDSFLQGSLELSSIVYFISVTALFLFLTAQSIQKRRYSVSVKNLKMGAYSTTSIIFAVAAVIIVNLAINAVPEKYTVFDITGNSLYSLTDETKTLLKTLDRDVDIYVYSKEGESDDTVDGILRRYQAESSRVRVSYVDPVANPQFTKKYSNSQVEKGSLIVESGDRSRVVAYSDLYEYEYTMNNYTYSYDSNLTGIDAEGQITSAIGFVTSGESHTVYYTTGHGEQELEASFTDIIAKANVEYKSFSLLTAESVPEDAESLIINSPSGDLNEQELSKIRDYANQGGNIIISLIATGEETPMLWSFLEEYGLKVENRLVLETEKNNYLQNPMYLLPDVSYDAVTSDVYNDYYVFAPYALAMKKAENVDDSVSVFTFMETTKGAYAKPLDAELTSYNKEEGDTEGPLIVGARVVKTLEEDKSATLYVFSCGNIFTASASSMVSGGNLKLFSNLITDSVNIENNISIPVKSYDVQYLTLTDANVAWWRNVTIILIPLAFLGFGLFTFLRRRRK